VRSIGADKVIDYTKEDFTSINSKYDLIIDNVADRSVSELKNALNPKGLCVIIGFSTVSRLFQHLFFGPFISMFGSKKVFSLGTVIPNKKDINFLKELLEAGKIKPVIDKSFSLFEVADSIRYVEKGHARGKVIINIGNRSNR
jgi:NADPH:quinone reductase-like Zn-dependent oxidoreductase